MTKRVQERLEREREEFISDVMAEAIAAGFYDSEADPDCREYAERVYSNYIGIKMALRGMDGAK